MFYHNNALTSSHPYASQPISWPFLLRGVSFWTKGDEIRQQIYLLGNPIGWWTAIGFISVFAGIICADQITRRRGLETIEERTLPSKSYLPIAVRFRLYNSAGYFLLAWAAHYFPFYLMGRQLFLHHYLPAHLASCLVTGALVQFLFSRGFGGPVSPGVVVPGMQMLPSSKGPVMQVRDHDQTVLRAVGAAIVIAVFGGFLWFAPLTYGYPGCSVGRLLNMKWLDSWDFQFTK
jgi:dolichyl-phosphate-mannose-protein mannosyltransferase